MSNIFQYLTAMGLQNSSSNIISDLLKKPNVQLEELLDEEVVVQEFKDNKPQIIA